MTTPSSSPESSNPSPDGRPVMHLERRAANIEELTGGRFELVGPDTTDLARAEVAIVGGTRWDRARFEQAPNLKVLARTGIGFDAVDLAVATELGVLVTNTPDGPTVSTAEHTMALLFTVTKTIPVHQQRLRDATGNYTGASTAIELDGLTMGLLGMGRIARHAAKMMGAIGMNLIAHDPFVDPDEVASSGLGVELVDFDELLARSDVLSLHAPLTPETAGLFDRDTFARCKRGVVLINAARGGLVNTDDLVAALEEGQVGAAGLDVTDPEPLDPDHPLLHRDDSIVTPHVASSTSVGRERMLVMAIEQATMGLDGRRPTHLVNEDVWPT